MTDKHEFKRHTLPPNDICFCFHSDSFLLSFSKTGLQVDYFCGLAPIGNPRNTNGNTIVAQFKNLANQVTRQSSIALPAKLLLWKFICSPNTTSQHQRALLRTRTFSSVGFKNTIVSSIYCCNTICNHSHPTDAPDKSCFLTASLIKPRTPWPSIRKGTMQGDCLVTTPFQP